MENIIKIKAPETTIVLIEADPNEPLSRVANQAIEDAEAEGYMWHVGNRRQPQLEFVGKLIGVHPATLGNRLCRKFGDWNKAVNVDPDNGKKKWREFNIRKK